MGPSPEPTRCLKCGQVYLDSDRDCPRCSHRGGLEPTALRSPEVLDGTWRLERKLGKGGMGTVYEAFDLVLQRRVAVKMLSDTLCNDPEVIARFEQEARLTAQLDHPNLVPIYAVGRKGDVPFIVMKYLEGENLSEHLRHHGRLAIPEVLRIVRQICAGLKVIHARGLVHRDIKPVNIFLSPSGHVTVLDLGVAHDPVSSLTKTGLLLGTPKYMAPEQILARGEVDHRADLYSLGAVIYKLATGEPVFPGESDFELMRAHTEQPPPDPAARGVPEPIARVIQRCLAKRVEERFQSAGELLAALEAAAGLLAPLTPTPTAISSDTVRASPAPDRRRRLRWGSVAAAFVILVAVGVGAWIRSPSAPPAAVPANVPLHARPALEEPDVPFPPSPPQVEPLGQSGNAAVHPEPVEGERRKLGQSGSAAVHPERVEGERRKLGQSGSAAVHPEAVEGERRKLGQSGSAAVHPEPVEGERGKLGQSGNSAVHTEAEPRELSSPGVEQAPVKTEVRITTTVGGKLSWAWLDVDGVREGTTPKVIHLPAGTHQVRLEQPGLPPRTEEIQVVGGQTLRLTYELTP